MIRPNWLPAVCEHFGQDLESWTYDPFAYCWHRLGESADGEPTIAVYDAGYVEWETGDVEIRSDVRGDVLTTLLALQAAAAALEAVHEAARVKS